MTKEQLLNILRTNGIKYDKDIERESTEGYVSDECEAFAEKLYGDLFEIVTYSVQNGFSKSADEIKELTKLIASLIAGTSRKQINLAKTEEKRQQILKRANYLRKEIEMEMLNELNKNLDACIAAAEAIMIIRKDNERLCGRLTDSKSLLEEIKNVLANAADLTSKEAAAYQVAIFEALMEWREAVSHYNCFSDTVDLLKGALEQAKKWQQLNRTVRHKATMNEDFYEYPENCDDIPLIISAAKYAERTEGMREHLDEYKNQTALLYDVEGLRKEAAELQQNYNVRRDEINARLAELKKQHDSVMYSYQNGEIDLVTADMKLNDNEQEQADLEEELANLKEDYDYDMEGINLRLSNAQGGSRTREKVAKYFEDFVKKIEAYKTTDPALFVTLAKNIDFNGVYDTLTGRLNENEIDEVYTKIEVIISQTEADMRRQRGSLTKFRHIDETVRQNRREEERVLREQEQAHRQRMREERASSRTGVRTGNTEQDAEARMRQRMAGQGVAPRPKLTEDGEGNPNSSSGIRNEDK